MSLRKFAKYRSRSLEGKNCPNSDSDLSSSSSSSESSVERRRKRKHTSYQEKDSKKPKEDPKHKPKRKKNYNDSSESLSRSDSEKFDKRKKKSKHKQNKDKKKKKKKKKEKKMKKSKRSKHDKIKKESRRETVELKETNSINMSPENTKEDSFQGPSLQEMEPQPKKRSMVPMTREEYEKQQSKIRRIVDPETGRHRLIKGDGEVLEEIVSYDRHKMINKMATHGDGVSFQAYLQKEKNL